MLAHNGSMNLTVKPPNRLCGCISATTMRTDINLGSQLQHYALMLCNTFHVITININMNKMLPLDCCYNILLLLHILSLANLPYIIVTQQSNFKVATDNSTSHSSCSNATMLSTCSSRPFLLQSENSTTVCD